MNRSSKTRLSGFIQRKDALTKVSPLNMECQKPASPSDVANSAKNASKKPYPIPMHRIIWSS